MNLAKIGLRTVLLIELCLSALIVLPNQLAVAQEGRLIEDKNGNYYIENGDRYIDGKPSSISSISYEWEVVTSDSSGLGCGILPNVNHLKNDYYNFPLMGTFKQGERIRSNRIDIDDQGMPWIYVWDSTGQSSLEQLANFTLRLCWARANSQFLRLVK